MTSRYHSQKAWTCYLFDPWGKGKWMRKGRLAITDSSKCHLKKQRLYFLYEMVIRVWPQEKTEERLLGPRDRRHGTLYRATWKNLRVIKRQKTRGRGELRPCFILEFSWERQTGQGEHLGAGWFETSSRLWVIRVISTCLVWLKQRNIASKASKGVLGS